MLERLVGIIQGLARFARLLGHFIGLHSILQLTHAKVKVGNEQNE